MQIRLGTGGAFPSILLLACAASFFAPGGASAQYFGRQKVQYENFDWKVMQTPHFRIHYYPPEQLVTKDAARMAERWYLRLSQTFQHEFDEKPLIFYADHPDFQQTNVIGGTLTESTGGVTEGLRTRVIMPFTGVYFENDHVLGHELVHVFQYDMAMSQPASGGLQGLARLPLWLVEGMAEYLSLGRDDPHTAMWLRDAALQGELPTIVQLTKDSRFFPYRYGQALWAYIAGRWGDRAVTEVYRFATRSGFEAALQRVLGVDHNELSRDWIVATRQAYLPTLAGRQRPEDAGDPVLVEDEIGAMHLSPQVSPDGNYVAFFGRRDIFTVDLYMADARTGEVIRRLASPERDQHYDALSFVQSAGTWSPDGRQFAFVVFEQGDNRLAILDVESADIVRRIEVRNVGAIQHPAWSPDGRSIAFSGMQGGISDLYVIDLESNEVRQLTDDRHADLQPAWAPDGRTIAFVSDRGAGTDFGNLTYAPVTLAFYDMDTGNVRDVSVFEGVKHINPQYSPDGQDLFFIGGLDGFSDIFRLHLATGDVYQVTRIATGISGITALSPAMSVAADDGRMLFSVFENSGNNIYGLEAERTVGEPVTRVATPTVAVAGTLPPVEAAGTGLIHDYLSDPLAGLPPSGEYETSDYSPSIALDYLGPPSFGVGASTYYGPMVSGGVSAFFGDMLGDHFIGAAVQANGTFKDIGGQAIYQNLSKRVNWGVGIGHIPFLTGFVTFPRPNSDGTYMQDRYFDRIFIDQASLTTRYPFSTTRRVELTAGYTRYSFDREIERYLLDPFGRILQVQRLDTVAPDPIGFAETALAYVGDNSYFGFTSPVTGQRFRFEVAPTFGTLQYIAFTADYRRYFRMEPFTLAIRGLHYGRYGRDASGVSEDRGRVLNELFLGYESLVRGYDYRDFTVEECNAINGSPNSNCPAYDRLFGERIGVASIELRIPLLGFPDAGLGLINFPFLPTEIAPFIDAGVAWTADEEPVFKLARRSDERIPVFSAGVSARVNLFGYFVFETYWAYPFQRPERGGHFGFQLLPGW